MYIYVFICIIKNYIDFLLFFVTTLSVDKKLLSLFFSLILIVIVCPDFLGGAADCSPGRYCISSDTAFVNLVTKEGAYYLTKKSVNGCVVYGDKIEGLLKEYPSGYQSRKDFLVGQDLYGAGGKWNGVGINNHFTRGRVVEMQAGVPMSSWNEPKFDITVGEEL